MSAFAWLRRRPFPPEPSASVLRGALSSLLPAALAAFLSAAPSASAQVVEPGLSVSAVAIPAHAPARPRLAEGFTATYTVVLKTDPGGTVTVTPGSSEPGSLSVSPAAVRFDSTDWDVPRTVTLTALQDENDVDESVTVSHAVSGYGSVTSGPHFTLGLHEIAARVTANLSLRLTGLSELKEGGAGKVEVELTGPPGYSDRLPATPFRICHTLGTLAAADLDTSRLAYADASRTCRDLFIAEFLGQRSKATLFELFDIRSDGDDEGRETVTVELEADPENPVHGRVSISAAKRTFSVADADPSEIVRRDLRLPDSLREGSGEVWLELRLDRVLGADEEVRVPLRVSGKGVDADDYRITLDVSDPSVINNATLGAKAPYTLTFANRGDHADPAERPEAKLKLVAVEDGEDELTETLKLDFGGVTSNLDTQDPGKFDATGIEWTGGESLTVDILDGVVVSVAAGVGVTEGGDAVFTVTATPAPPAPLDVTLGIAQTGAFVAAAGLGPDKTLKIPVSGSADYTVTTLDDEADEADGEVTLALAAGKGYRVSADAGSAAVAVADDDATTVRLSAPASVAEGGTAAVTATLSLAPAADVEIPVTAGEGQDDTAEDVDFSAPEKVVVKAGATSGSADIATAKDADRDDESFTVALGDTLPSGIEAGDPAEVTIGITDDGLGATVSLSAAATTVKDSDDASIKAVLSHVFDNDITVPVSVAGSGTNPAEAGEWDAPASIDIAAGATEGVVTVGIVRDQDTDDETFTVSLGSPLSAGLSAGAAASVEITIDDDGKGHDISLTASPDPVKEGKSATITATANGIFDADTAIPLVFKGHGARKAEAGDWDAPSKVTVRKGAASGTVTLDALGDIDEDDETVRVSLGTPLPAGVVGGNTFDLAITDTGVPAAQTLTLGIAPAPDENGFVKVAEGASVTLTATLGAALSADLELGIERDGGIGWTADEDDHSPPAGITIKAGQTSASASVTAIADGKHEGSIEEEFRLVVLASKLPASVFYKNHKGYLDGVDDRYVVKIEDRDKPRPTIGITSLERRPVTEGGQGQIRFTAKGDVPSGGVAVKFKVEQDGDFLPSGKAGDQTLSITKTGDIDHYVDTQGDANDEANGAVTVTLLEDPAYEIDAAGDSVTLSVLDNDPTIVSLTGSGADINENGGTKKVTISLSRALASGEVLEVVLDEGGGNAGFGADFIAALKAAAPGVRYSVRGRGTDAVKQFPTVTFTGGAGASRSAVLKLTAVDDKAKEGKEEVSLSLAQFKDDFGNVQVRPLDGAAGTGLGGGARAHALDNAVSFGIVDDDSDSTNSVTVAPTSLTLAEGEEGVYFVVFDRTFDYRNPPDGVDVGTHKYTVTPASQDTAATFSPQKLDFGAQFWVRPAWHLPQKITVTAVDDGKVNQTPRTATITHAVAGYDGVVTAPSVTVTVRDAGGLDVTPAALSVQVTEKARLDINLVSKPDSNVVVNLASGAAGIASLSKTALTFTSANWNVAQAVEVTGVAAGKADVAVSVDNAGTKDGRYVGKRTVVPVTVAAKTDARPAVTLSAAADSIAEGGTLRLTARLSAALSPAAAVTIPLVYTNGTAEDADYAGPAGITIASGQTEGTADLAIADNAVYEGDETLTVRFGALPATLRPGSVTEQAVTIGDDADLPVLQFISAARSVDEDAGELDVDVLWTGESELDASVAWATADGTATAGSDYAQAGGTITRKAGATAGTATVKVSVIDDGDDDPGVPETFAVRLSKASGARVGARGVHTVSVTDDDPTEVRLIADSDDIAEASGEKTVEIRVVRDLVAGETLPVPLVFGGAAEFGVDYTLSAPATKPRGVTYAGLASTDLATDPPTLTFAGGDGHARIATLILAAVQDAADEGAEEDVTVTLGALDGGTGLDGGAKARAGEDRQAFAIADDDGLPVLAVTGGSVDEGGAGDAPVLAFTVSLAPASGREVTVQYADSGTGTASPGTDYAAVSAGTLTFKPGETSRTVTVTVTGDADPEPDETVVLRLSAPVNAVLAGDVATLDAIGTIAGDEVVPELAIAAGDAVAEGGRAAFTVTADVAPLADLPVKLAASQEGDFVDPRYLTAAATIAKGARSATFEITTQRDQVDEPDGSVTVAVEDGGGIYTIKSGEGSASVPVTDRNPTSVSLAADGATALLEGDATSKVSLTLSLGRDLAAGEVAEIPLDVTSATGVAIAGKGAGNRDYVLTATGDGVTLAGAETAAPKVTFTGAGGTERSAAVVLTATARDDGDEGHETFTVALGSLGDSSLATNLSGGQWHSGRLGGSRVTFSRPASF